MSSYAMQKLERAGVFLSNCTSLQAAATKTLLANLGKEDDPLAATAFTTLMDPGTWSGAKAAIIAAPEASYITEYALSCVGLFCGTAIAVLTSGDTPATAVRDHLAGAIAAVAAFVEAVRRHMVNLESPHLRIIVATNTSAAVDLLVLAHIASTTNALAQHCAVTDTNAISTAAESLASAVFNQAVWCFAGEPNGAALTNAIASVTQSLVETKKLPNSPTPATMQAARAVIGHNRSLPVKTASFCAFFDNGDGTLRSSCRAAFALLSVVISTPSARAAVFYRFDDEMLLMNNTSATECRALLSILLRTPYALPAKRKAGGAPMTIAKAVDGLCDCFDVMKAAFTAFAANGHWRSFAAEKRRLMLARAAARPQSTAAATALGADAGLKTAMLTTFAQPEDAIGRLSHGLAKLPTDGSSDAGGWSSDRSANGSANGETHDDDDEVVDARSEAGGTDGGRSHREQRSEGGYTHMSARTAASTIRGRAVIEAVKDLFIDAALQNASDAAANVHLPLVLLELFLGWTSKALAAFSEEFINKKQTAEDDANDQPHFLRAARAAWSCIESMVATAAHKDVFSPADDSRFNSGLGLAVLEKTLLGGILLPALSYCTSGVLPPSSAHAAGRLGTALCELAAKGNAWPEVLRCACAALVVLDSAVPIAVQRHLPHILAAFGGSVPEDRTVAAAVETGVSRVLRNLVTRLGAANQLSHLITAVQSALLDSSRAGNANQHNSVLAHALLQNNAALESAVRNAAAAALDAESLVASVNTAIAAAVATEASDDDEDDDKAPKPHDDAVSHLSKAALITVSHWVLVGVAPSSLTALPLLESLVELDVSVATHTAGNVLTRIAATDATAVEAQAAYDAKPSVKRLRPWLDACEAALQERFVALKWLQLLDSIRRLSTVCAQDLGVSAPETFLQAMEDSVWQYGSDIGTIVVAFSCEDLEALLNVPDALTALPAPSDVSDSTVAEQVRLVLSDSQKTQRELTLTLAGHVGHRLARGASMLGVLRVGEALDDGARRYNVAALLSTNAENVAAAKKMAKSVHRALIAQLDAGCTTPAQLAEIYGSSVAEVATVLHPAGASALCTAVLRASPQSDAASLTIVSIIADALCRRFAQSAEDTLAAVRVLWTATKKQLLSKPLAESLKLYELSTSATSPSKEDFEHAVEQLRTAVAVTSAMHAIQSRRGALPGSIETTTIAFELHRDVLAVGLGRADLLGQSAKPTSALSLVLCLISNVRRISADALRLATALHPSEVPEIVRRVMHRRPRDEDGEHDTAMENPDIVSDCVTTVSVDGEGTQEFLSALVSGLTFTAGSVAVPWGTTRAELSTEVVLAIASGAGDLLRTSASTGPAFLTSETVSRFMALLDMMTALPRFAKLADHRVQQQQQQSEADNVMAPPAKRKPRAENAKGSATTAPRSPMCDLVEVVVALCGAVLHQALTSQSNTAELEKLVSRSAKTLRHVVCHGLNASVDGVVAATKASAALLVEATVIQTLTNTSSLSTACAADCLAAAWALCAATEAAPPTLQLGGRGLREALSVSLGALADVQRAMQHASTTTQQKAVKWISTTSKAAAHAVTQGHIAVNVAAAHLHAYLTVPNVKVSPIRTLLSDTLCAALRCTDGAVLASVLEVCRLPLQSLHRDASFVSLELALVSHALGLNATHSAALVAACRVVVLLVTVYPDSLQACVAELPIVVRLLTRATLQGLQTQSVDPTAASLLGSTLYHLSRHKVLSLVGRSASPAVASAMAFALYSESAKFLTTASTYSLELDTCGFDIISAAQERIDIVFGSLRGDPQAQSLLRRAASRLAETKEDQVAVDAGIAMPGRSGPVAFATH